MATKKNNIHICSECFGEFNPKSIFIASEPRTNSYSTLYCGDCLTILGIDEFEPYQKTRKKSVKNENVRR